MSTPSKPTAHTTKPVDLDQLSSELGGGALTAVTAEDGTTVTSHNPAVTKETLASAIAAHVAPDQTARSANKATIQSRAESALENNRTFLAITSPTNAQIVAQVKALTRQNNALIRLALGRFDAID